MSQEIERLLNLDKNTRTNKIEHAICLRIALDLFDAGKSPEQLDRNTLRQQQIIRQFIKDLQNINDEQRCRISALVNEGKI